MRHVTPSNKNSNQENRTRKGIGRDPLGGDEATSSARTKGWAKRGVNVPGSEAPQTREPAGAILLAGNKGAAPRPAWPARRVQGGQQHRRRAGQQQVCVRFTTKTRHLDRPGQLSEFEQDSSRSACASPPRARSRAGREQPFEARWRPLHWIIP